MMKRIIALFALTFAVLSCSSPRGFYTYKVASIPSAEEGVIYLESSGIAGNEKDAYNDAAGNAFSTVLYKGLPGSVQPKALVDDEALAKKNHPGAMDCFTKFECYNKFIVATEKTGIPVKEKNGTVVNLRLKINLSSLKTYLETNGVIRRFGF